MISVKDLVDRGLVLKAEIAVRNKELKDVEKKLTAIGITRTHEALADEERDGRRWFARGTEMIVPVVFTADIIVGSFGRGTPTHLAIENAAGGKMSRFYKPISKFENLHDDGKKFRAAAAEELGLKQAPPFVTACLARDKDGVPKSQIKIEWDAAGMEAEVVK